MQDLQPSEKRLGLLQVGILQAFNNQGFQPMTNPRPIILAAFWTVLTLNLIAGLLAFLYAN
jgi:hypothetical protein